MEFVHFFFPPPPQLGQKQKVLEQLQRQNSKLQEQLGDALGREESARDGYVPQVSQVASPVEKCRAGFAFAACVCRAHSGTCMEFH